MTCISFNVDYYRYIGIYQYMNIDEILKVLGNANRREILMWLKNPRQNFPPALTEHKELEGVCGTYIFEKSKLSQATISQYLKALEKAGLVKSERHGQWTFFSRNEKAIKKANRLIKNTLKGKMSG